MFDKSNRELLQQLSTSDWLTYNELVSNLYDWWQTAPSVMGERLEYMVASAVDAIWCDYSRQNREFISAVALRAIVVGKDAAIEWLAMQENPGEQRDLLAVLA